MLADYRLLIGRSSSPIERGCMSKISYSSRRDARSTSRHGRHQDGSLAPYHCANCGAWHLGHRRRAFRNVGA
jgi:hypothetical protein